MNLKAIEEMIITKISDAIKKMDYYTDDIEVNIEIPKDTSNGDFSSNIAMKYARVARKAPFMIADEIKSLIEIESTNIEKVEVAKPGFLNFYLKKDFLLDVIKTINDKKQEFGSRAQNNDVKYNIEFVSVNPTGAIHIGHARGAAAGDSLARIMKKAGYNVTKEYYVNDAGNQIHNLAISIEARYKELHGLDVEIPKDGYHGPEIIDTAKKIKVKVGDKFINEEGYDYFREFGVNTLLDELKQDLKDFDVTFDVWFSEKSLYDKNAVEKLVEELKSNGFTYEKDGATWLKTSEYNDEKDRVIIKSDGTFTYLTPDIAYHKSKIDRGYDRLIDILGGDHHGYIDRLKAAIEMATGHKDILEVEILQMVKVIQNGEEVKMSKRSGKAITLRDLVDEVGKDPIRYFFAARSLNTQMDLDLDLAIRQTNENPVYYLQYANARIHSIFEQAKSKDISIDFSNVDDSKIDLSLTSELLTTLALYPEIIMTSAESRAPHKLTTYLHKLASQFHSLYNAKQFVTTDQVETKAYLSLLNAVSIVIEDGLSLIGVSAPTKM